MLWVVLRKPSSCDGARSTRYHGHIELASSTFTIASNGIDIAVVGALAVALDCNRQCILDDVLTSSAVTRVVHQSLP